LTLAVAPGVFPTRAMVVAVDDNDDDDDELEDEVEEDKVFNNELFPTFDRPIKAISGTP
jgi:hypothetical protein